MTMENQKKALKWRCRRGMQEMDILLIHYLEHHYDKASVQQQKNFAYLLEQQDDVLWDWLSGQVQPDDPDIQLLIDTMSIKTNV